MSRTPEAAAPLHADPDPRPRPPPQPDLDACCGSGCVRCVFDVYDEAVERYEARLKAWQTRHPDQPDESDQASPPD